MSDSWKTKNNEEWHLTLTELWGKAITTGDTDCLTTRTPKWTGWLLETFCKHAKTDFLMSVQNLHSDVFTDRFIGSLRQAKLNGVSVCILIPKLSDSETYRIAESINKPGFNNVFMGIVHQTDLADHPVFCISDNSRYIIKNADKTKEIFNILVRDQKEAMEKGVQQLPSWMRWLGAGITKSHIKDIEGAYAAYCCNDQLEITPALKTLFQNTQQHVRN